MFTLGSLSCPFSLLPYALKRRLWPEWKSDVIRLHGPQAPPGVFLPHVGMASLLFSPNPDLWPHPRESWGLSPG